jgi:methylated-DNA-[protein]-cysteine S-methyltransferase
LEEVRQNNVKEEKVIRYYKVIDSPIGLITLTADIDALLSLTWGSKPPQIDSPSIELYERQSPIIAATEAQLDEYFCRKRTHFDIPIAPSGTEFQLSVWQELTKIPYGQPITYGEQASRLGKPQSARAVGSANGKNPIGIIIPCHRVIGSSGTLTGFSGGIEIKKHLLTLEGFQMAGIS